MQKLPKEIEAKRKMVDNLQKVIDQPALGQDDIAALKEKMKTVRGEIEELTNKKNVSNDPIEDKLTLFRQRVSGNLFTTLFLITLSFSIKKRRRLLDVRKRQQPKNSTMREMNWLPWTKRFPRNGSKSNLSLGKRCYVGKNSNGTSIPSAAKAMNTKRNERKCRNCGRNTES